MNCGLYIGCGTDFEPTEHLRNVRKFIFIDSQPLTSHGTARIEKAKLFLFYNYS